MSTTLLPAAPTPPGFVGGYRDSFNIKWTCGASSGELDVEDGMTPTASREAAAAIVEELLATGPTSITITRTLLDNE